MDIYHKWKEVLSNDKKRKEWMEFYQKTDPILNAVVDFCNQKEASHTEVIELAIIAILDAKVKMLSEQQKMAHYMTRPLPDKLTEGQRSYPEDIVDFGSVK